MAELSVIYWRAPNRQREDRTLVRLSDEAAAYGEKIKEAGFVIEAETLSTGHESLTVGDSEAELDLSHCFIGPSTPDLFDKMNHWLLSFDVEAMLKHKADKTGPYSEEG